jgi:hypothetical protein
LKSFHDLAEDETENDKEGTIEEPLSQDEIFAVWGQVKAFMRSGDAY